MGIREEDRYAMIKPINLFESERNSQNDPAIESSKMQKRILERRQKALEDQAAKGKADAEEVRKIAEEIANYKEIKPMKLYVDDQQTNARLYRQGQKSTVVIQHIITKGTIDEQILKALQRKDKTQSDLINAVKADLGGFLK